MTQKMQEREYFNSLSQKAKDELFRPYSKIIMHFDCWNLWEIHNRLQERYPEIIREITPKDPTKVEKSQWEPYFIATLPVPSNVAHYIVPVSYFTVYVEIAKDYYFFSHPEVDQEDLLKQWNLIIGK